MLTTTSSRAACVPPPKRPASPPSAPSSRCAANAPSANKGEPPRSTGHLGRVRGAPALDRSAADATVRADARVGLDAGVRHRDPRSEEHTSELQSLMRISY